MAGKGRIAGRMRQRRIFQIRSWKGNTFQVLRDVKGRITKYLTHAAPARPISVSKAELNKWERAGKGKVYELGKGFVVRNEKGQIAKHLTGVSEKDIQQLANRVTISYKYRGKRGRLTVLAYNKNQVKQLSDNIRKGKLPFDKNNLKKRKIDLLLDEIVWLFRKSIGKVGS